MSREKFNSLYPEWTPERVLHSDRMYLAGVDLEGGGIPMGSGDMIRDAKECVSNEVRQASK